MKINRHLRPRAKYSKVTAAVLIALATAAMAGCGGGGGGGSSSGGGSPSGTETFAGTFTITTPGGGLSPYTAHFDSATGASGAVGSNGAFSITVPSGNISGNDIIYIVDSTGTVIQTSSNLTNDTAGETGINITLGPPSTPPL